MTDEEVRHREAIRALVTKFTIHSDRARFADVASCFTRDGLAIWHTGRGSGREDIEAKLKIATANPSIRFVRHNLTTMHIELSADMQNGTGRIYFFSVSNAGLDHAGVYVDRYMQEGDCWLIVSREVRLDWQAPTSLYPQN